MHSALPAGNKAPWPPHFQFFQIMKTQTDKSLSRRRFIQNTGLSLAAVSIVPRSVLGGRGHVAPSDTVYLAGIGIGGKGESDLTECAKSPHARVAFLCDVDDRMAGKSRANFPDAPYFKDFREMLEQEHRHIDAVIVSTPDHTHAAAAMAAMQLGKHVYVQKPLTHNIYEARMLAEAAAKYRVVTQMGNQFASDNAVRRTAEFVQAGLIGEVERVLAWTNRPVWPQGVPAPTGHHDIPPELAWDLWLGPAREIAYNPAYLPFNWRGWWEFGTGALGDIACHLLDATFRILPIDYPSEVECSACAEWEGFFREANYRDSCPAASIIHLKFPRTDGQGHIKLTWMDGGLMPERPDELLPDENPMHWEGGYIFEGTKGKLLGNVASPPLLLPTSRMNEAGLPPQTLPRVPEGHYVQWVEACRKGYDDGVVSSPFSFAGPFTEAVLMGNLALRSFQIREGNGYPGRKKLYWDAKNMRITNFEPANAFVRREYRKGWTL
jgi:predicted dehydrogenase